jgi:hypothetical protein
MSYISWVLSGVWEEGWRNPNTDLTGESTGESTGEDGWEDEDEEK